MYRTCIFCRNLLGTNERIEHFPVGRRLAFDSARGRLRVVCPSCARWNLTPLEARWEAIEECERFYSATPRRMATSQVGLAVAGPFSVVRIGAPPRRELAWWRYGRRLRRRLWGARMQDVALLGTVAFGLPLALGAVGLISLTFVAELAALSVYGSYRQNRVLALLGEDRAGRSIIRRRHLRAAALRPSADAPNGWVLRLRHDAGVLNLAGQAAVDMVALALATLPPGNPDEVVDDAVVELSRLDEPLNFFDVALARAQVRNLARPAGIPSGGFSGSLTALTPVERVAMEMTATEERERRAIEGELAELESAWRDAEEVAAIADNLLLPDTISGWLNGHRDL